MYIEGIQVRNFQIKKHFNPIRLFYIPANREVLLYHGLRSLLSIFYMKKGLAGSKSQGKGTIRYRNAIEYS